MDLGIENPVFPALQTSSTSRSSSSTSPAPQTRLPEKQVTVLKNRDEQSRTVTPSVSLPNIPASTTQGETPPPPSYIQRQLPEGMYKFVQKCYYGYQCQSPNFPIINPSITFYYAAQL